MTSVLKALREKAGLSQHELARKSETDQGNISRVENGQAIFAVESAESIAQALGVDPVAFMLTMGLDTIQTQAAAGKLLPHQVAEKSAQLISIAAAKPGLLTADDIDRLAGMAAEAVEVAEKAARRSSATKARSGGVDIYESLDRDTLGLKRKPHHRPPVDTQQSATKGQETVGEFDMLSALGRESDGTRRKSARIEKLGHYHLPEESYGGAQGTNPGERRLGEVHGGAEVARGPIADGEPGPASRKDAAGADALGRGAGGRKLQKKYGA